jgi:hypothetical protein
MQQNFSSYSYPHTALKGVAVANKFAGENNLAPEYKHTQTVRISISWQEAEGMPYFYNWDAVAIGLEKAKQNGVQPIWDLCCSGFPDSITPLQPSFARRFAAYCQAFVRYCKYTAPNMVLTVASINESAFFGSDEFLNAYPQLATALKEACDKAIAYMKEEDPIICILANHPVADIISLLGETRLADDTLAIAS